MSLIRNTVTRCLMAAAGATAIALPALAQQAERSGGLEEIIVTAQKRVESAQDVPIALSGLSSAPTSGASRRSRCARPTSR